MISLELMSHDETPKRYLLIRTITRIVDNSVIDYDL